MANPPTSESDTRLTIDGRWLLLAVTLLSGLAVWFLSVPAPSARWVIGEGQEDVVRSLVPELEGEVRVERFAIEREVLTIHLSHAGSTGRVRIHHVSNAPEGARLGDHVAVLAEASSDPEVHRAQEAIAAQAVARDPALFRQLERDASSPSLVPIDGTNIDAQLRWTMVGVAALALLSFVVALLRRRRLEIRARLRLTHLLPAVLQSVIFAYWFWWWPDGRGLAIPMIAQVAAAYLIDISLSFLVLRSWTLSFGVLPIVFSTHLLAQFRFVDWWGGMAAVAIALIGKTLVRREGRPMFNPSALGLSLVALLDLFWQGLATPDNAAEFHAAPFMTWLIVALALIVQLRLRVVLVTLSAALALALAGNLSPEGGFDVSWAPITLVLCLLVTDPSTMPRTQGGRVLFGAFIGAAMVAIQVVLVLAGHTDFWAKVMAVPVANALVPTFDRWGARLTALPSLAPERNPVHVLAWLAFVAAVALL